MDGGESSSSGVVTSTEGHTGEERRVSIQNSEAKAENRKLSSVGEVESNNTVGKGVASPEGADGDTKKGLSRSGSIKRRSIRRRPSKRAEKTSEAYGNDKDTYEAIQQRVLKERAVVNAIEALEERWRMIMFMYQDCSDLNDSRKQRQLLKLTVKRQEEMLTISLLFLMLCVPVTVVIVVLCR